MSDILLTTQGTPATPAAGQTVTWYDTATKTLKSIDDTGTVTDYGAGGSTDRLQALYVGKHGLDTNTGVTPDSSFLTIGAAITAASALTPSSTNNIMIIIMDGGTYTENLTIPSFVRISGEGVTIVGNHTIADSSTLEVSALEASTGTIVSKLIGGGEAFIEAKLVNASGPANAYACGAGILHTSTKSLEIENGSATDATSTGEIYVQADAVEMSGTGIAVENASTGSIFCNFGHIEEIGAGVGVGTAFVLSGTGETNAIVAKINAATAWTITNGTFNLQVSGDVTGTRTVSFPGDANIGGEIDVHWSRFRLHDANDETKGASFTTAGITTGNTRVMTFPDASGTLSLSDNVETQSNKTLTTPTIGSMVNANHDHSAGAGGGLLPSSSILLDKGVGSADHTLQDLQDLGHSSGVVSAVDVEAIISLGTGLTVDTTAFSCYLRVSNSPTANLIKYDIAAITGIAIANDNTDHYLVVDYNAGTPQITATTVNTTNGNNTFLLGTVFREVGVIHEVDNTVAQRFNSHAYVMTARFRDVTNKARANGSVLTEIGTLNINITEGLWWGPASPTSTNVGGFNSSGGDRYTNYYQDGIGGWTQETLLAAIDTGFWDDGTGIKNALTPGSYGVLWVYLGVTDGDVRSVLGQAEYATQAEAEDSNTPTTLPPIMLPNYYRLVGKAVYQQGATSLSSLFNVNSPSFESPAVINHETLAGLNLAGSGVTNGHINDQAQTIAGAKTFTNDMVLSGNLTVQGTTTTVSSTQLDVADKNITMGNVTTPTDVTADGGGITIKGTTDKTIIWDNANNNFTSSESVNLVTGLDYKINNTSVLNATTLGAGVVNSSLTSTGTLGALTVTASPTFSAMTAGSVLFAGAAGLLSQDNANFFWDDTNNFLYNSKLKVGGDQTIAPTVPLTVVGSTGSDSRLNTENYQDGLVSGGLQSYKSRGTETAPTSVLINDQILFISGSGYYGAGQGRGFTMRARATENFATGAYGTSVTFATTPNGSTTNTDALTLDQDQSAIFTGNISGVNSTMTGTSTSAGFITTVGAFPSSGMGERASEGLVFVGSTGTTSDMSWWQPGLAAQIMSVPTGTNNVEFDGQVLVGGQFEVTNFLSYNDTNSNLNIGSNSLSALTTGVFNVAIGKDALSSATSSSLNVAIGASAGKNVDGTGENFFLGASSGFGAVGANGSANVAIGKDTMTNLTSASNNVAIGKGALNNITSGSTNIALGNSAGSGIGTGVGNITMGGFSMVACASAASRNICMGEFSGIVLQGSDNVCIGANTGKTAGSGNVFLGSTSGKYETGSNILIIDNQDRTTLAASQTSALLYGSFNATPSSQILATSGSFGIGTTAPVSKLHVDQPSTTAVLPVITLDQADISEGFIDFIGSDRGVVNQNQSSSASVRVELNGVVYRLALYADA